MKRHQFDIFKIILLCCGLSLGCFGAEEGLQVKTSQKIKSDFGWFFGVGIGGGLEKLKAISKTKHEIMSKNFASLVTSGKIGFHHTLRERLQLRYYYSFDMSFNSGHPTRSTLFEKFYQTASAGAYTILRYHMLNLDTLIKAYTFKDASFDVIAGVGMGITNGVYAERHNSTYFLIRNGTFLVDWDMRLNLGARFLFDEKHGFELIAKIPLTSTTINRNLKTNDSLVRRGSAYFTFDYVMQF